MPVISKNVVCALLFALSLSPIATERSLPHAQSVPRSVSSIPNISTSVPPQALHDALEFRQRYEHASHVFKFFDLTPIANPPGALEFVDNIIELTGPVFSSNPYLVIFDLDQPSSADRLHIINLVTGSVESVQAAHGRESDCGAKRPGFACRFISDRDSKATPLGFFVTGETYHAHMGTGIRLNGLETKSPGFPGNDVASTIIIHGAVYVQKTHVGLSWGCPALNFKVLERVKA